MNRPTLGFALVAALALTPACLSTISEAPVAEDDTASLGPFPENYEEIVRNWILNDLFRVVSIDSLDVTKPEPGMDRPLIGSNERGWRAIVSFSGRDRIGTSTGRMDYTVLIRDGEVVSSQKHP